MTKKQTPSKHEKQAKEKAIKAAKKAQKQALAAKAKKERLESDYEALKPADFDSDFVNEYDVGVGNVGGKDPNADKEKKQEFSKSMGVFAQGLNKAVHDYLHNPEVDIMSYLPPVSGSYIGKLAEQERRFANRRIARSVSLAVAQEAMAMAQLKLMAKEYLSNKVTPTGYASKKSSKPAKRSVVLLLSDLHLGAELSSLDNPMPFGAVQEARRLEFILRQALDYKPQYRKDSELVLLLNGDLIQGLLLHDMRDGAPLAEQKVIFWTYFREFIGYCAQQFPSVRVFCQPGNHGRDKVRHPGRATSRKWDSHEWELYWALKEMCSGLPNVTWDVPFRAVCKINLYGATLGLSHGDTEIKLSHPDKGADKNALQIAKINNNIVHHTVFDAWCFGHFHTPRIQPGSPTLVYNGALIPPDGHARSSGYIGEPCGQFLFESVEGHVVGDLRFIGVGPAQDNDEQLGKLIKPFRLPTE